jgi:hypothetical protein
MTNVVITRIIAQKAAAELVRKTTGADDKTQLERAAIEILRPNEAAAAITTPITAPVGVKTPAKKS